VGWQRSYHGYAQTRGKALSSVACGLDSLALHCGTMRGFTTTVGCAQLVRLSRPAECWLFDLPGRIEKPSRAEPALCGLEIFQTDLIITSVSTPSSPGAILFPETY
jgi:hypothetical protein